jgi:hypothetical protein
MSEYENSVDGAPVNQTPASNTAAAEAPPVNTFAADVPGITGPAEGSAPAVNPVRSAAGRLGARRQQQLIEYGRKYERDHHLTPGRQRLRQLVQLGKRYEQDHGLKAAAPARRPRGDAWTEFLAALARVVKPVHRPAVERLAAALAAGEHGPDAESV